MSAWLPEAKNHIFPLNTATPRHLRTESKDRTATAITTPMRLQRKTLFQIGPAEFSTLPGVNDLAKRTGRRLSPHTLALVGSALNEQVLFTGRICGSRSTSHLKGLTDSG